MRIEISTYIGIVTAIVLEQRPDVRVEWGMHKLFRHDYIEASAKSDIYRASMRQDPEGILDPVRQGREDALMLLDKLKV